MSKARQLAELGNAFDDGALSNRNLIINGAMQIAQRGTSFTADNIFTLDRWKSSDGTGGTPARTLTQEEFTLGQTDVPNAHYYLKHNQTGASTNSNAALQQKIENVTRFDGTTITLSFYAKANASFDLSVDFIQDFGTGGSPSSDVSVSETVTVGTTWQKYTVTKTLGSMSGKTLGTDGDYTSFLNLNIVFLTTSTFTFEATLFQLEVGDTATPFEHRSYGQELALCQRYYQQIGDDGGTNVFAAGSWYGTNNAYGYMSFLQTMRAAPTVTAPTASNGYKVYTGGSTALASTLNFARVSNKTARVGITTSGGTTGQGTWFELNGVSPCNVILDAEL